MFDHDIGYVEDERVFHALGFQKSKVRNKLDKNFENCLRLYNFPYERQLKLWRNKCQRRGLGKISNNENNKSSNGIGSIDFEAKDQARGGMQTGENWEHNEGLVEVKLDGKEFKDSNDEM